MWLFIVHAPFAAALAWIDLRHRKIPNVLVLIWACATLVTLSEWAGPDIGLRVMLALGFGVGGGIGFFYGVMGGGDVKVLPLLALLSPADPVSAGCYGLAMLIGYGLWRGHPDGLPFGVPLGAGLILTLGLHLGMGTG